MSSDNWEIIGFGVFLWVFLGVFLVFFKEVFGYSKWLYQWLLVLIFAPFSWKTLSIWSENEMSLGEFRGLIWIRNMTNITTLNYIFTQQPGEWDNRKKPTKPFICFFIHRENMDALQSISKKCFLKNVDEMTRFVCSDQIRGTDYKIWEDQNILPLYWLKQYFCGFF